MEDILFLIQYKSMGSSARGYLSGGRILTKEDLLDARYYRQLLGHNHNIFYQIGRNPASPISSMSLSEFESCFSQEEISSGALDHLLGKVDGFDCIFRSEISKKYGKESKTLTEYATRYSSGLIVKDKGGFKFAYLGKFRSFYVKANGSVVANLTEPKHVYIPLGRFYSENFNSFYCERFINYLRQVITDSDRSRFSKDCF